MEGNVLVPLDGSGTEEFVLPYAEELAVKMEAGISLLGVSEAKRDYTPINLAYLEIESEDFQ